MEQQDQTDLLQDIQDVNYVDPVPAGVRFVNYLVDQIVMGLLVNGVKYGLAILSKGAKYKDHFLLQEDMSALLYGVLLSFGIVFTYYLVFETASNGRTIGKILTGTIAITHDGSPFTFKHALLRTL
jgi:uncharacterized RDD family membrane protein YckC